MPAPNARLLLLPFLLLACSPRPLEGESATTTPMATTDGMGSTSTPATGTGTSPEPTTAGPTSGAPDMTSGTGMTVPGDPADTNDSCGISCPLDFGPQQECDPWTQDCPPGEKCAANDDFTNVRCVPVVDAPKAVGEPCTITPGPLGDGDDCDVGAMCWNVDPDTGIGTCQALCSGSPDAPICPPGQFCPQTCQTCVVFLCVDMCDPLGDDCPQGQSCIWDDNGAFVCVLDASGDEGQYGDPCEFLNACDPGLACVSPETVPACMQAGCCAPFCDLSAPACPDADLGVECLPWFGEAEDVPGLENLGICGLDR